MTEEKTTTDTAGNAGKKKPAAKRAPSKTKTTSTKAATVKKPAARKAATPKKPTKKPAVKAKPTSNTQAAASQAPDVGQQESAAIPPRPEKTEKAEQATQNEQQNNGSNIVEDLKGRDWPQIIQRALLMVFFGFLAWVTISVAFFLATAQVIISIFVGEPNAALTRLIKQGANYIHDVLDYLSFASDECPFPFGRNLPDPD